MTADDMSRFVGNHKGYFVDTPFTKIDERPAYEEIPSRQADRAREITLHQFATIRKTRLVDTGFETVTDPPDPVQQFRLVENFRGKTELRRKRFSKVAFRVDRFLLRSGEPLPNPLALAIGLWIMLKIW